MKVQFASDLHLEFPHNQRYLKEHPLVPNGDILVLAGDIIPFALLDGQKDFFDFLSDHYRTTYWLPGNHEYYHGDINMKSGKCQKSIRDNVYLVNNIGIVDSDIKFVFTTLWSHISVQHQWQLHWGMNDFKLIKVGKHPLSVEHYNQLHCDSLSFLENELKQGTEKPTIVATHHVPTFLNYPPQYKGDVLNEGFATELSGLVEASGARYWIYGHHHSNTPRFSIGSTKMVTNQVGYVSREEHLEFQRDLFIEV